jgi:putative ABC transport system substrate-binding protein
VATGLVASLAQPGGNITGMASSSVESGPKAFEVFTQVVPGGTRVAVLWNPANSTHGLLLRAVEGAARALGVPLYPVALSDPTDLEPAFAAIVREHTGALIVIGDPTFMTHRRRIAEFAIEHGLPTMHDRREYVAAGGLMAYGSSFPEQFRRVAVFVDKILKGTKPADLPLEQPMHLKLIINLKTAQALGLTISPTLLFLADEVIR